MNAETIARDPHPIQALCRCRADDFHQAGTEFVLAGNRLKQCARALRLGSPRVTEETLREAVKALERGMELLEIG